jgi:hypothetical protein
MRFGLIQKLAFVELRKTKCTIQHRKVLLNEYPNLE